MSLFINDWKNWCRTCGKNNFSDFLDFLKWNTLDEDLLENIQKFFQNSTLAIPADDNIICIDCYSYLKQFLAFTKQCRKISDMFTEIHLDYASFGDCDLLAIRNRYDLQDDKQMSTKSSDIDNILTDDINSEIKVKIEDSEFDDSQLDGHHSDQNYGDTNNIKSIRKRSKQSKNNYRSCKVKVNDNFLDEQDNVVNEYVKNEDNLTKMEYKDASVLAKVHLIDDEKPPNKKNNLKCAKCNIDFNNKKQYKKHMDQKHPKMYPFNCNKCSKGCLSAQGLSRHRQKGCAEKLSQPGISPKDPIVCEQCGKSSISVAALSQHQALVHNNDYRYECSKCLKQFKTKSCLKRHEKTHGSKSIVCDICGLRFITKPVIRMHMLVHSELKKYKCNYCGHEFKRRRALQAHLITHAGLKPYKCPFCDKSFTYGTSCRLHKKTVHPKELAEQEATGKILPYTILPKCEYLQPTM